MSEKGQKILIIDDSILIVKILSKILESEHEIITASSAEQGLKMAVEEMPDLILLDVLMGEMDGYEACHRFKENSLTKDIPVIFITGLDNINDERKGLEAGAIDYIYKPFSEAIVKIRIKNHLELKRHRDMLTTLSSLDGLTGIYNRRYFDINYNLEWIRSLKNQTPLSLLIMDIDYFKLYNDCYGHLNGDDCLKKIAETINTFKGKASNFVCRYGGEEFVCVMPETNISEALDIAKNIIKSISSLAITHRGSTISQIVTLSCGLETIIPNNFSNPINFVREADNLLYEAKKNGRNRIQISKSS